MPRYVKKIPKTVESALNAFEELSENAYASANERTKNTEILARRITALEKRNKRWAIVMTLLATGAIGVAVWYARATGLPLTANMIVSAKTSMGSMMGSAAATLKSKGRNIVKYFKGNKDVFYGPQKESMTALAQRKAKNFKNVVGKKVRDVKWTWSQSTYDQAPNEWKNYMSKMDEYRRYLQLKNKPLTEPKRPKM